MKTWLHNARAQAALLDLDGVLLDSAGLHDAALVEGYEQQCGRAPNPLPWTDEGIRSSQKLKLLGVTDVVDASTIRAYKARRYLQLLEEGGQRWHSPLRLRAALQGLTAVALVTSFSWEQGGLARVLNTMGLVGLGPFDQIFAPYDGTTVKVSLYQAAAAWLVRCRRVSLDDTLVLEDSTGGVDAARAAGFTKVKQITFQQLGALL